MSKMSICVQSPHNSSGFDRDSSSESINVTQFRGLCGSPQVSCIILDLVGPTVLCLVCKCAGEVTRTCVGTIASVSS